jgi:hypothetical protein
MGARTGFTLALLLVVAVLCLGATLWIHRGFRARSTPPASEAYLARKIRNFAIPGAERRETEGPPNTFVRSHTFKFIAPASTVKYKIPNACSSCHEDKSPEWAAETVRHWSERSPWRVN